jgi:hypothetical protein
MKRAELERLARGMEMQARMRGLQRSYLLSVEVSVLSQLKFSGS